MDGWVDGQMDVGGWADGWMGDYMDDGWMDR